MWGQLGTDGLIDLCSRGHPVLLPQNDQDVDVELDVIHQPFLLLLEDSCHQIWPVLNAGPIQLCLDLIQVGLQVIVMKRSGLWYSWQMAIPSWNWAFYQWGLL